MSVWIDRKYLLLLSPKLELFKQRKTDLYSMRCPYCGDSQKIKSKTRGFVYAKKSNYFFTCFNCGKGSNLKNFIGFLDPYLEKEYTLECFQENYGVSDKKPVEIKPSIPKFKTTVNPINLPSIAELPDSSAAKQYIVGRQLPESSYKNLYFAEDFKQFVEEISGEVLNKTGPRIIIPFFSKSGELVAFQGRAIDSDPMRYVTIKIDPDSPKIFGLNTVNDKSPIMVCEGPFDSLFIPNCIATADSNLSIASTVFSKDKLILVPDNEPRNKSILKNIRKFINTGYNVCLFPESFEHKDINDAIKSGLSTTELLDIINNNTFNGLRAELEFVKWRKL